MSAKRVEVVEWSGKWSQRDTLPIPLLSCELWMFVEENPDRKKRKMNQQANQMNLASWNKVYWCMYSKRQTLFKKWLILSKLCKSDNFKSHNTLCSNFVECESFLKSNSSHSCSMWDKLEWFNLFWQFLCEGLSSFDSKGF